MKIRSKLAVGFSVLLVLMVVQAVMAYIQLNLMRNNHQFVVNNSIPVIQATNNLMVDLLNEETGTRGFLLTGDQYFLQPYLSGRDQLKKDLEYLQSHSDAYPKLKELLNAEAVPKINRVQDYFQQEIDLAKAGKMDEARANFAGGKVYMDDFRATYADIANEIQNVLNSAAAKVEKAYLQERLVLGVLSAASIVIAIAFAVGTAANIVVPIQRVSTRMKEMALQGGDLTQRIEVKGKDEVADLARSFNQMLDSIQDILRQVLASTEQVAATSEQLTAGAEQVGQGATEISNSIQAIAEGADVQLQAIRQASETMRQMTAGVQQAAESAQNVTVLAAGSAEAAEGGRAMVKQITEQMEHIEEAVSRTAQAVHDLDEHSAKIGSIVGVIQSLAEQTNLLALNAAIEAARAGDQGRGFAVVAGEIRKLAEQSSSAAGEIKALIDTIQAHQAEAVAAMERGTDSVATGTRTVEQAGETFTSILENVQGVTNRIQDMSAIVEELSAGTDQILHGSSEIVTTAQKTAGEVQTVSAAVEEQTASIEEITASAKALAGMAEELLQVVRRFKV
ncbi:methyl-accepting chemotaxis protein [Kyrpidia sp.]|uniref:methyl-accepting chemotaxis protein n=1 Tax=Kyrpidia sp. TaxID=2073077 RepID=UPI0025849EDE|nr:methyl-accepting chemotaxis protein [Kyrpidia sp.]MCL6574966.1 CHASE3 domain-containing protein [Kyrpidia sp.]